VGEEGSVRVQVGRGTWDGGEILTALGFLAGPEAGDGGRWSFWRRTR
jgi:hypothetical protein